MDKPGRHLPVMRVGNPVFIEIEVRDELRRVGFDRPGAEAPLMDPSRGVILTITYGALQVPMPSAIEQPMTRSGFGIYHYTYPSLISDPLGLYNLELIALHGGRGQQSQIYGAFKLVE